MSKRYYVNALLGSDTNDGLSEKTAFQSLFPLMQLVYGEGDEILLARNSVFSYQFLHLRGEQVKASAEKPLKITAYGEGALPHIQTRGQGIWYQDYGVVLDSPLHRKASYVSSALLLYDVENIEVSDLELSNAVNTRDASPFAEMQSRSLEKQAFFIGEDYKQGNKMQRTGLSVIAQNKGTLHNLSFKRLYIHDVHGNVYDKHLNNGGIYMTALQPYEESQTGIARFDGVTVEDCFITRVSRWGLAVGYTYKHATFAKAYLEEELFEKEGHTNILIRNNFLKNIGGDGITVMYALQPLVDHNEVYACAYEINDRAYVEEDGRGGKVAAGIWPWKCKNAYFTKNFCADTRLNQDGMAYDADSGDGTVYERNYSRLNEGGCIMFCLQEAVNSKFIHNMSEDDLGGTVSPSLNPDAYIANNLFYVRESVPFVRPKMDGGEMTLENNDIIYLKKE